MKTSIEYWSSEQDRRNQTFTYRGTQYTWCSFAEGAGQEIIGFIVFNHGALKYELWLNKTRDRLIEVNL